MVEQKTQPEAIKRRQLELRPLYAYSLLDVDQSRLMYAGRPVRPKLVQLTYNLRRDSTAVKRSARAQNEQI